MNRAVIIGTGSCLPERVLTNADLEQIVDTSDEWITTRTGISTRRIAERDERTSALATKAAREALSMANVSPKELDLIFLGTITSDMAMPSCACLVQKELGAVNAAAMDLNAACSGFVYGLDIAEKYIKSDPSMKILVIGAETLSTRTNWKDRNTCVLFGDGAGASVLTGSNNGSGILSSRLYSDGSLWQLLSMESAPRQVCPVLNDNPADADKQHDGSYIKMVGKDVFRYAVRSMEQAVLSQLEKEGVSINDVNLMIPHQANIRILRSLVEKLNIPIEKVFITVSKYGNTSAASIPICIDEANRSGRLTEGDLVLLCVFGGGFTWGVTLIRW